MPHENEELLQELGAVSGDPTLAEMQGMTAELGLAIANLAEAELEAGHLTAARGILEGLVVTNHRDAAAWALLSTTHRRLGQPLASRLRRGLGPLVAARPLGPPYPGGEHAGAPRRAGEGTRRAGCARCRRGGRSPGALAPGGARRVKTVTPGGFGPRRSTTRRACCA